MLDVPNRARARLRTLMRFLAAIVAGLLQFLSDQPFVLWPLQSVALVPLWLALASTPAPRHGAVLGFVFAASSITPLLLVAGAAPPILVAAAAAALQWTLLGWLAAQLLRRGAVRGALATAAAVTLVELAISHGVPMFGTAQMSVRPLSAAPMLVAFVAYTGTGGLLFVVMALQTLLASALRGPERRGPLLVAAVILGVVATLDLVRWTRPLGPVVRVAAVGWGLAPPAQNGHVRDVFDAALAEAAAAGARLAVTPETSSWVGADRRPPAIEALGGLAKRHGIAAAFGVWNDANRDNRIWWFDPAGELRFEYRKTHLIPWLEDYVAGDGTLVEARLGDLRVGGMICQDDNFTDVARGYGRAGVPLLVVPTNDWPEIRGFHLENSIFRSIENGYAVVRAASGGISALVSPRGERVASHDHIEHGPKVLVADLPTGDEKPTLYARLGDLPVALGSALLLLFALLRAR